MWKDTLHLTDSWAENRFVNTDTIPPFGFLEVCLLNLSKSLRVGTQLHSSPCPISSSIHPLSPGSHPHPPTHTQYQWVNGQMSSSWGQKRKKDLAVHGTETALFFRYPQVPSCPWQVRTSLQFFQDPSQLATPITVCKTHYHLQSLSLFTRPIIVCWVSHCLQSLKLYAKLVSVCRAHYHLQSTSHHWFLSLSLLQIPS